MGESIFVKSSNLYYRIDVENIEWIQSEGNYCTIQLADKRFVVKMSLSSLLAELSVHAFTQVHKRYIVNKDKIDKLDLSNNQLYINKATIPIGRTFKTEIIKELDIWQ